MTIAAIGGAAIALAAWVVVPGLGLGPFSTHMASHTLLVAVAAPLLAWGAPAMRPPWGALPVSFVELVVVWAWHAPAAHHASMHVPAAYVLEQAVFLACGVALWSAAVGGTRQRRRARAVESIVGLLLTAMHMTVLGVLIGLAPRVLYGHGTLLDQQIGAAIMVFTGGASYLAGALGLAWDLVRGDDR